MSKYDCPQCGQDMRLPADTLERMRLLEKLAEAARRYHGGEGPRINCAICRALDRLDKASGVKP